MVMSRTPTAMALRRCCNCKQPFVGEDVGTPSVSDFVACCSECYWSAAMDPTGARRRAQTRKERGVPRRRVRGGGGAAAAAAVAPTDAPTAARHRRQRAAVTPVATPPVVRRVRPAAGVAVDSWDMEAAPQLEGTKWLGSCASAGSAGAAESEHALFDYHLRMMGPEEGV